MCIKNSPPDMKTRSMTKKDKAKESLKKPARRTRTKTRKPKFLSLRRELSSETSHTNSTQMTQMTQNHKNQLNLFPLHPENLVEDKDIHDENVAFLFNSEAGSGSASLNFLIVSTSSEVQDSRSPFCYGGQDSEEAGCANNNSDHGDHCNSASSKLLKTAMRIKERDPSTEKWVCYSEVVEKKELEEVTSCSAADTWCTKRTQGLLSLKLDYQEIMNAWSHKGPLYIEGESPPQTVPDLHDDHGANVLVDGWGSVGNVWRVPEMGSSDDIGNSIKVKEEFEGNDGWKMRHREASVLRYKEKRQNRLFSKRIRYEVRKLNAEKRPRMKQIRERGFELNSQHRRDQICH